MKIESSYRSCVVWNKNLITPIKNFESINGHVPTLIEINKISSKYWRMEFCHELGHIYLAKKFSMDNYNESSCYRMRIEMMAQRVAKSFCKSKYWNENNAIEMLETYAKGFSVPVNMHKIKKNGIIPLNRGISFGDKEND